MMVQPHTVPNAPEPGTAYRLIWRWHFFAGLVVAPFIVILAVTGSLYLYGEELESWLYADVLGVPVRPANTSASMQEAAVLAAYPQAQVLRFTLPERPGRAVEWMIRTTTGEVLTVMVDPADAHVTGALHTGSRLTTVLGDLHGELMLGRTGDLVVEMASCWTIVLLVTGAYLWWPRRRRLTATLVPRVHATGRRLLRDLHAVPAIWNLPIVLFLLLSGLPWSGFWGQGLAELGTLSDSAALFVPTPNFSAPPPAAGHEVKRLEQHQHAGDLPWSIRQAPLPGAANPAIGIALTADDLMRIAAERGMDGAGLRVLYPQDSVGIFTLSFIPDSAFEQRTVHINPADGRILGDIRWSDYSALGKTVELGVIVHMGRQFGELNRLVLLLSCLVLIATVGFGIATWWRRRHKGRLSPPPRSPGAASATIVVCACVLGLLFPLAGMSMLFFFGVDWMISKTTARKPAG